MRSKGRRLLLIAGCVLAFAGLSLPAAGHAAKKRANLVVRSVRAAPSETKPYHRFVLAEHGFGLRMTVENVGDGPTLRNPAALIETRRNGELAFRGDHTDRFGRLGPGEKTTFPMLAFASSGRDAPTTVETRACVSVRGLSQTDNVRLTCRNGPGFAVVPRAYDGSASATMPVFGFGKVESLSDPRFAYEVQASQAQKKFVYRAAGQIVHTVSGSNATCSISGSANSTFVPKEAELSLDTDLLTYRGQILHPEIVPATQICNGISFPSPVRSGALRIGPKTRIELDEGDPLVGTATVAGVTFKWNLLPE